MNLIPFALFSEKIPATFLVPEKKKPVLLKNIFSLFLDYLAVSFISALTTSMISLFFNSYLGTLSSKFQMAFPSYMGLITLPLMLFTYYSICFYACDGLTIGSRVTKQRINEGHALKQAFYFTLTIATFGATYFLIKNSFVKIDYRYDNLVTIRDERVDLHTLIKDEKHEDQLQLEIAA
ncbi:MAG TPA: hypothetical protein VKZ84_06345 [Bacteriovoracaceae bacterium]|nr:hypothetical protein [Bacteriovoracaceae bacterium]